MTASREIVFLNSFYIGINLENILYGIELLLYFRTMHVLLRNRGVYSKSSLFYALFSTMLLICITGWVASQALFGENMWVLASDFPGGPYAYWKMNIGVWYMGLGTIAVIILQLMTDALMIYRCWIIWNSSCAVSIPILLWLATLTLGILVAWATSEPRTDFHTGIAANFSVAYWAVSVFLNTTLTSMICYRVLQHGRKIREHLGNQYANLYFAVVAIIVESVLPYTLSGIVLVVVFGTGIPSSGAFLCVYFMMTCISPQILILRVAAGTAWNRDSFSRTGSTLKFSPASVDPSVIQPSDNRVHVQALQHSSVQEASSKVEICEV